MLGRTKRKGVASRFCLQDQQVVPGPCRSTPNCRDGPQPRPARPLSRCSLISHARFSDMDGSGRRFSTAPCNAVRRLLITSTRHRRRARPNGLAATAGWVWGNEGARIGRSRAGRAGGCRAPGLQVTKTGTREIAPSCRFAVALSRRPLLAQHVACLATSPTPSHVCLHSAISGSRGTGHEFMVGGTALALCALGRIVSSSRAWPSPWLCPMVGPQLACAAIGLRRGA
jgi:hypothetical protein